MLNNGYIWVWCVDVENRNWEPRCEGGSGVSEDYEMKNGCEDSM